MKTNFLGKEEVRGYLLDFLERLDPMPTVWCAVTQSGNDLLNFLLDLVKDHQPKLIDTIEYCPIDVQGDQIVWEGAPDRFTGKSVLMLDGAIHSGRMMSLCADEILKQNPAELASYALVVKRSSCFIPTLWGVMTAESDRSYFLLDSGIPNNRLDAGDRQPLVQLRKLERSHLARPPVVSGLDSIDRVTWSDRHFQMQVSSEVCTYVLERANRLVGFLTVVESEPNVLSVAEVVVGKDDRKQGYGGILIRFADTLARQSACTHVRLNSISDRVKWYEQEDYRKSPKNPIFLDQEEYVPMEKRVLYHQPELHGGALR